MHPVLEHLHVALGQVAEAALQVVYDGVSHRVWNRLGGQHVEEPDNRANLCRSADNDHATPPRYARLPINRCNIPPVILGGLAFQHHPMPLQLDGVAELHADLFRLLDAIGNRVERAEAFRDYMTMKFFLEDREKAGLTPRSTGRVKANWMRILRGASS